MGLDPDGQCCVTLTLNFPLPDPSPLSSLCLQGSGKDNSPHKQAWTWSLAVGHSDQGDQLSVEMRD